MSWQESQEVQENQMWSPRLDVRYKNHVQQNSWGPDSIESNFMEEDLKILMNNMQQCFLLRNIHSVLHWASTVVASKVHIDRRGNEQVAAREILIRYEEEKFQGGDGQALDQRSCEISIY